jgi:hypothetical protein
MVVQEVRVGQEVLEAHVLTLLEDPTKTQTATVIIIHAKRAPVFLSALTRQCVLLFSFSLRQFDAETKKKL